MSRIFALGVAFLFVLSPLAATASAAPLPQPTTADLIAGRHHKIGKVKVWNDRQYLYVKYETARKVYLDETHLHVADTLAGIPQTKKGNPIPGRFDYKKDHDRWVSRYTCRIPLESGWTAGTTLTIAAHAAVYTGCGVSESARADGRDFPGSNWATYFTYTVQHRESKQSPFSQLWGMLLALLAL